MYPIPPSYDHRVKDTSGPKQKKLIKSRGSNTYAGDFEILYNAYLPFLNQMMIYRGAGPVYFGGKITFKTVQQIRQDLYKLDVKWLIIHEVDGRPDEIIFEVI